MLRQQIARQINGIAAGNAGAQKNRQQFGIGQGARPVGQQFFARTFGIVFLLLVVPAFVDGVFGGVLIEVYKATEYPLWEAGLVQFFLALPVHMTICSAIHAKTVGIRIGQGLAVWLVEKLLKLALILAVVGVITVLVLAGPGK